MTLVQFDGSALPPSNNQRTLSGGWALLLDYPCPPCEVNWCNTVSLVLLQFPFLAGFFKKTRYYALILPAHMVTSSQFSSRRRSDLLRAVHRRNRDCHVNLHALNNFGMGEVGICIHPASQNPYPISLRTASSETT